MSARTWLAQELRGWSRGMWVFQRWYRLLALAAFFALMYASVSMCSGYGGGRALHVGDNTLDLDAGKYTLWWETLAHPNRPGEFLAFRFKVEPAGGEVVRVRPPKVYEGLSGRSSRYSRFSVGSFSLKRASRVRLTVRVLRQIDRGVPYLTHGKPFDWLPFR